MHAIPNSSAMDAAAGGGGPTTSVLPWIVSTEPEQVQKYITELVSRITKIVGIVDQINDAGGSLRKAWSSGSASDGAASKVTDTINLFQKIVKVVQALEAEIQAVAMALRLVQNAYRAVVSSVNPTVRALLSNHYTRPAATALSLSTTSGLASFVSATKATLDTIGLVRLLAIVTQLATIASALESLLSDDSGGAAKPTPSMSAVTGTQNPALGGYGTGGWNESALGSTGTSALPSGVGGWTGALAPAPGTPPTPAPMPLPAPVPGPGTGTPGGGGSDGGGGGGGDVTISTTHGDLEIEISVPAEAADDLSIDLTVTEGGEKFTQHIDLDLDGSNAGTAPASRD